MKRWRNVAGLAMLTIACSSGQSTWQVGSEAVDSHVVSTLPSAEHYQLQDSIFRVWGWPLGTAERNIDTARWYVRNPTAMITPDLLATFASNVTPPKDARYTNYHNSTFELWLAPSDQDVSAYIKTEGRFERWPRAAHGFICS